MKQDAREAMRVVFSVLAKRICMHKTKFLMNILKCCFKNYIQLMNLKIAAQLIMMVPRIRGKFDSTVAKTGTTQITFD